MRVLGLAAAVVAFTAAIAFLLYMLALPVRRAHARDFAPPSALARALTPFVALGRDDGSLFARSRLPERARSRALTPYRNPIVRARDDGRYANDPLHAWFDQLASGKGLCCSFADGESIADVDWDTMCSPAPERSAIRECRYRVRLHGEWIEVPPAALVTEPNRDGRAFVWPYTDADGATQIRCFLPGAGA